MRSFRDGAEITLNQCVQILMEKRELRGTDNIQVQGLPGVLRRMQDDKMSRVRKQAEDVSFWQEAVRRGLDPSTVMEDPTKAKARDGSGIKDDLMDIINYSVIAIALIEGWWDAD